MDAENAISGPYEILVVLSTFLFTSMKGLRWIDECNR